MNRVIERVRDTLLRGEVATLRGCGHSMEPRISPGRLLRLVPVLTAARAQELNAQEYVLPEALAEGDAVWCKVNGSYFTHEIVAIRRVGGKLQWQIAPHHRRHVNGWTYLVYGKFAGFAD